MKECTKCRHCYEDDVEVCPLDNSSAVHTIVGSTTISGRYILESRLGQGGMGIVFRAKHKFLKSAHAVKIILPSLVSDDKDLLVRFNQEAVLAASIDHPNVIRVTDFGVENDIMPFLVMEFIDGIPLSNYLIEDKPLALRDALSLFIPVAEGVAQAHSKGIVHRDLKPQNIMVQKDLPMRKAVKVLDFGLAKIKSADSYPSLIQAKTMSIVGSPPYMSPEQWSGEGVDHRTDIYALAVILYQMLTGHLPFQADSMPAMMYQHLTVAPPTAESWGVKLLPGLEAVVQKALEKDPQNRYDSMDEMLADLEKAIGTQGDRGMTGAETEYMIPRASIESAIPVVSTKGDSKLSDSQKERFYSYFDSQHKPDAINDPKLAQEFLQAQDRIESAKTEAINADMLVQELAEAQKQAEEAQLRAQQAKERIEADVRRKVEAEMQRLAVDDQAKREAEAERLAQEVEARRAAEERANYLAQAALEAQQLAETERNKREEEAQQREVQQGVREKAESEARQLTQQVAEARQQYEDAKNEAAREAQFRFELEQKQKKIEDEIQILTYNEAEQRKLVEASAKKYIEEQAARFETEANQARHRLDEAKVLIDQEAEKREQAEAARIQAEKEAERLSQEIVAVQRQMEEMQQHITSSSQSSLQGISHSSMPHSGGSLTPLTGQSTSDIPSMFRNTGATNRKPIFAAGIGIVLFFLLGGGAIGAYFLLRPTPPKPPNGNSQPGTDPGTGPTNPVVPIPRTSVLIQGGTFQMGRDDIADKKDDWGNQFPAHPETVKSFNMDIHETTNGQYTEFVKEDPERAPSYWAGGKPPAGEENLPVTKVSLGDAQAFAAWISKRESKKCRLPTEIEWEFAARNGPLATSYPWGADWQPGTAKLDGRESAVGSSLDVTQVGGLKDMLGNVSEWTSSTYSLYKGHPGGLQLDKKYFVVRGLNFETPKELFAKPQLLLTFRNSVPENGESAFLGFRVVCEE